jgi:hypothetical protein
MADPEEPSSPSPRKRASTLQESGIPAVPAATPRKEDGTTDVFESHQDEDHVEAAGPELKVPSTFDELPVEIKLQAERFLERLSAKVHPTPFTAEALSDLFQDFYERAAGHISTHIATLSSRIGRETPPASSKSSLKSVRPRAGSGNKNGSNDSGSGGEMLTASEVADRKKARRLLEVKRLALEEAVERGVCEKIYEKIWKHRTTDDDARDEKLRSRTAALALVGIGLKELHMDPDPAKVDVRKTAEEKEQEIYESLSSAREALQCMDDEHYPLGKLQHLTAAHKSIVETLSQLFPKTSSADEILPTLIYTLITCPPEGINLVSNLNFIQRFRSSNKLDGEAAYCLVNLEAAISFLETVDLSSLRADELPEGPPKSSSRPTTPTTDRAHVSSTPMPALSRTLTPNLSTVTATPATSDQSTPSSKPPITPSPNAASRPQLHQRRISAIISTQADRLENGRDSFLSAADKVYDSINGTLDNSLQFLFGRFKEQQQQIASSTGSLSGNGDLGTVRASIDLPKTLEEARRLVSSPSLGALEDEIEGGDSISNGSARSGRSSPLDPLSAGQSRGASENKMLELLGGRGAGKLRDRSADSSRSDGRSTGSNMSRRVTWDNHSRANATAAAKDAGGVVKDGANFVANTINSINPLNRFGMPGFPRFGRPGGNAPAGLNAQDKSGKDAKVLSESPTSLVTHDALGRSRSREPKPTNVDGAKARTPEIVTRAEQDGDEDDELNARETLAQLRKCKPPRKRFLDVSSASELKLGEVEELLGEYRRLAKVLGDAFAQSS